jgi:hypothetical protein
MTTVNRDNEIPMARCKRCDSDLIVSKNSGGYIFCTNMECAFVKKPHPTKGEPNSGEADV